MSENMELMDGQPPEADGAVNLDIFAALWRQKWIVVAVMILASGMACLYYLKAERIYRSSVQILLVMKEAGMPRENNSGKAEKYVAYEDSLSTQMILLKSPLIVRQAVEKYSLASLCSFADLRDPASQIIGNLKVIRGGGRDAPDPNVMEMSYEGLDPEDCEKVLLAIVKSYQEFLGKTYESISNETIQLITQAKDQIHEQLTEKEAEYRAFRQKSPLLWKGPDGANIYEARLADIEKTRSQILLDSTQTKARVAAIEAAMKRGSNREALSLLIGTTDARVTPGTRRETFEDRIFSNLLEEQSLLEEFGADHPKVRTIRRQMNLLRAQLGGTPTGTMDKQVDFLALFVQSLKEDLKINDQKTVELDKVFLREQEAARNASGTQLADEQLRIEIARIQQMFDQVIKRLQEISLVKDYTGLTTQLISPPGIGYKIKPNPAMTMAYALVASLLAGCGLAYLIDVSDTSFRTPDQIRKQLALPVLAHIPVLHPKETLVAANGKANGYASNAKANGYAGIEKADRQASNADPNGQPVESLWTVHNPRGRVAEAFRAIRTALYFSARNKSFKVIQVTSPNPGDGKSTVIGNLAVAMSQSGKKVLLVDGDLRQPRIHKSFAVDNSVGLSSVIRGEVEFLDAIQTTAVKDLWVLTSGPRPKNPADLLTLPRFKEFLDWARKRYDFVLVDSPPLLAVTDPAIIAAGVDAVVLAIRISKYGRHDATQAKEMLKSTNAETLGIVVNAVAYSHGYGEGYPGYRHRYQYQYKYRSGYRYGYNYKEHEKYYDESPEEPSTEDPAPDVAKRRRTSPVYSHTLNPNV